MYKVELVSERMDISHEYGKTSIKINIISISDTGPVMRKTVLATNICEKCLLHVLYLTVWGIDILGSFYSGAG